MYIQSIHIENLKCFQGVHDIDLTRPDGTYAGWTVVAGRNGSGKTTLLKAMALSAASPAATARSGALVVSAYFGAPQHGAGKLSASFKYGPKTYTFSSKWTAQGSINSSQHRPLGFLSAWGALRDLSPQDPADDHLVKDEDLAPISHLFMGSPTLINALDWLKALRFRELEGDAGAGALLKRVLGLVNDGLLPDGVTIQKVSSQGIFARRASGEEQLLQEFAAGYATVASLVLDMVRHLHNSFGAELFEGSWAGTICDLPGVVLIDEVEAHLHVSWQRRLGPWLCRHFPALQFIVTTHSPFVCQAASPRGIIRLPSPGTDERLRHVSEGAYKAIVHGDINDAVMSELFGLDHDNLKA